MGLSPQARFRLAINAGRRLGHGIGAQPRQRRIPFDGRGPGQDDAVVHDDGRRRRFRPRQQVAVYGQGLVARGHVAAHRRLVRQRGGQLEAPSVMIFVLNGSRIGRRARYGG